MISFSSAPVVPGTFPAGAHPGCVSAGDPGPGPAHQGCARHEQGGQGDREGNHLGRHHRRSPGNV